MATESAGSLSEEEEWEEEEQHRHEEHRLLDCLGADMGEYIYKKCGGSSVDNALVAVSRFHLSESLTDDWDRWLDQGELITAVVLYWVVTGVQYVLIFIFYTHWVEIKEDPYENDYYAKVVEALTNATLNATCSQPSTWTSDICNGSNPSGLVFNNTNMSQWIGSPAACMQNKFIQCSTAHEEARRLCMLNRATPLVHGICLWIWFGEGLSLVGAALWRFMVVFNFTKRSAKDVFDVDFRHHKLKGHIKFRKLRDEKLDPPPGERNVTITVQHMNPQQKAFSVLFILMPSLILQICVAWTGASYIALTTRIGLLVKASLKMNFIARMDKIIFPSFVSYNWENYVSNSQYKMPDLHHAVIDSGVMTIAKALTGLVATCWCTMYVWPQIEEYRLLCKDYHAVAQYDNVLLGSLPVANFTSWWYPAI